MIPGTSVTLDAPDGFTVTGGFTGLENLESGSSITIGELPAEAYEELAQVFTNLEAAIAGLAPQGVSVERATSYEVAGQQVPVLIGSQSAPGGEIGKYMALFRNEITVLMTFNIFEPQSTTPSSIERTIASVRLLPPATLEQKLEMLPFSLETAAPFRAGDILGGSAVLLSTFEGIDLTGLMPVAIVVRAISPVTTSANAEVVARQLLGSLQGFEDAEVTNAKELIFGGGPAIYLEAITQDRKVVQYLGIPPDGMYIRLVAYGAIADLERLLPAVADIAQSVSVRQ